MSLDLDRLEAMLGDPIDECIIMGEYWPALIAELRASRKVVEAAREFLNVTAGIPHLKEDWVQFNSLVNVKGDSK